MYVLCEEKNSQSQRKTHYLFNSILGNEDRALLFFGPINRLIIRKNEIVLQKIVCSVMPDLEIWYFEFDILEYLLIDFTNMVPSDTIFVVFAAITTKVSFLNLMNIIYHVMGQFMNV